MSNDDQRPRGIYATGSSQRNNGEGPDENQNPNRDRVFPHNLQGLLRFATEATRSEDASGYVPGLPMDEERRRFLEVAIDSITVDVTQVMRDSQRILSDKEIISQIKCDDEEIPLEVANAFENLMQSVYNIDMAIGFYKLGGYEIFPVCFSCEHSQVRASACRLLAELCQNNPFCQLHALDCGFLHMAMGMLRNEQDGGVLKAALYAVSCLVREQKQCANVFLSEGGCSLLARCIRQPFPALRNKAAFLICCLYPIYPEMKDGVLEIVAELINALKVETEPCPDQILPALHLILTSGAEDQDFLEKCAAHELGLKETILTFNLDAGCIDDDVKFCEDILKIVAKCANADPPKAEETDLER